MLAASPTSGVQAYENGLHAAILLHSHSLCWWRVHGSSESRTDQMCTGSTDDVWSERGAPVLLTLSLEALPSARLSRSCEGARLRRGGESPPSSGSQQPCCRALLTWLLVITRRCTEDRAHFHTPVWARHAPVREPSWHASVNACRTFHWHLMGISSEEQALTI